MTVEEEKELFSKHEFAIITCAQKPEEERPLPRYRDVGRILVRVLGPSEGRYERYELEVIDYDGDSCVFWIEEGTGIDYWINEHCKFSTDPGVYVIEGIKGHYYRGTWGYDDDWEEWEFSSIRPATAEEIAGEALCDPSQNGEEPTQIG